VNYANERAPGAQALRCRARMLSHRGNYPTSASAWVPSADNEVEQVIRMSKAHQVSGRTPPMVRARSFPPPAAVLGHGVGALDDPHSRRPGNR